MKLRALMMALVAVLMLVVAQPQAQAQAQSLNIPNSILEEETFTPEQRTELRKIVMVYIEKLKVAKSPNEIRDIVSELMKPLTIGDKGIGTATFKVEYSSILSSAMTRIMEQNYSPTIKAAVLKIASQLSLGTGHLLALNGLTNDNPAVRFWATKATIEIISRSINERYFRNNGIKVRTMIMESLQKAMEKETEPIVMEKYYQAMGLLRTISSVEIMLDILNERLALYNDGINDNIRADHEGIERCWRTLFLTRTKVDPKITKKLVVTAVFYAQIARLSLAQNEVSIENYAAAMNMLTTAESIMLMIINNKDREEGEEFSPLMKKFLVMDNISGKMVVNPELSVKTAVESNNLLQAVQRFGNWINILVDPKNGLGYKMEDFTPKQNQPNA